MAREIRLEEIARGVLRKFGHAPPVDALALAAACGLRLRPTRHAPPHGGALLDERIILFDPEMRPARRHGVVAHELAHWALRRAGEHDDEAAASYVGGALLLPRAALICDVGRVGLDLRALRAVHRFASNELVARRLADLGRAHVLVLDRGQAPRFHPARGRPPPREWASELALAHATLRARRSTRAGPDMAGFYVRDLAWHRAIVLRAPARGRRAA